MKVIKIIGSLDEQHRFSPDVPAGEASGPGPVIDLAPFGEEEEAGMAWEAGVTREWVAEWSDPREDIYTITDGKPVDGSR